MTKILLNDRIFNGLKGVVMAGSPFVITEACVDTKDRACVDVCPVQCIYEFDPKEKILFSEQQSSQGNVSKRTIENTHRPNPDYIGIFGDSMLYINPEECTSCNACISECPVGAIYTEDTTPNGTSRKRYNKSDTQRGHDHTFFIELNRNVFAD